MKALVYKGSGQKSWQSVPDPTIQQPRDVVVKMAATTICGTDLDILTEDVPEVESGRVLGHEGIGVVTDQEGILLSDILPTGSEIGILYGHVVPGDTVAVIESGHVGLAAVMTSRLYGPPRVIAIDLEDSHPSRATAGSPLTAPGLPVATVLPATCAGRVQCGSGCSRGLRQLP